jgi:hypothetical protein
MKLGALKTAARRVLLSSGRRVLGPERVARLAVRMGREPPVETAAIREHQRVRYSHPELSGGPDLMRAIFESYYGNRDPNTIIPAGDVAGACSYVPYVRGVTSSVVFNFFRFNYGIRDPILYRRSVVQGRNVIWSEQQVLPPDGVALFEDPAREEKMPERGSLLIEAFHPRIATPQAQLRYFVLYRDDNAGTIAGTHSMPCPRDEYAKRGQPSYRGFGVGQTTLEYHAAGCDPIALRTGRSANEIHRLTSGEGVPVPGYMLAFNQVGVPCAIWHDGPTAHTTMPVKTPRRLGLAYAAFFVPDFKSHSPLALVSSKQVGFRAEKLSIYLTDEQGNAIAERAVAVENDDATVDFLALFPDAHGAVNVIVEFDRDIGEFGSLPTSYIHLYYRSPGGVGDQVHSHSTYGYAEDPFKSPRPYRCRKFAPYVSDGKLEFTYSIVNLAVGRSPIRDRDIRIRVFTDGGTEHVLYRQLSASGITNFKATDLFEGIGSRVKRAGIVQFEHETTNFNGAWLALDRASGHLGTDHFTGG